MEYFSKMGMRLPGSMEVQWEEISYCSQPQGFCYYFVEYVIKGYSGYDHIQGGAYVQKMKHILKETTPSVEKVFI